MRNDWKFKKEALQCERWCAGVHRWLLHFMLLLGILSQV
jgi:hypothetical protein